MSQNRTNQHTNNLTSDLFGMSQMDLFLTRNILFFEIPLYVLYSVVFLFGILGNSIVIYVLLSSICINRHNSTRSKSKFKRELTTLAPTKFQHNNSFKSLVKANPHKAKHDTVTVYDNAENNIETQFVNNNNNEQKKKKQSFVIDDDSRRESIFNRFFPMLRKFFKEKLTVTNFYLLNLAISDFFYLLFMPVLLLTLCFQKWLFGSYMCKVYFSMVYLCQCSSVFILVVLSVDRYLSVKFPLKTSTFRSDELARLIIFFSWLLSFLFTSPITLYTELKDQSCQIHWPEKWNFTNQTSLTDMINSYLAPLHLFYIYTFSLNYLIPVSIIVILYTQILKNLHQNSQKNTATKQSKAKRKSHRHITKMVLTIIICYIVCWTPYWCYQVFIYVYLYILKRTYLPVIFIIISHYVQVVAYMSSALNPFIYSYMSEAFRTNLNGVLESCNCCFKVKTLETEALRQQEKERKSLIAKKESVDAHIGRKSVNNPEPEDINVIREEEQEKSFVNHDDETFKITSSVLKIKNNKIKNVPGLSASSSGGGVKMPIKKLVLINTANSKLKFEINFHGFKNFKLLKNTHETVALNSSSPTENETVS